MDEEDITFEEEIEVTYESGDEEQDDITFIPSHDTPDSVEFYNQYSKNMSNRITDPRLTKYEKTKILAERTQQIENGAVLYIPLNDKLTSAYSIALEEFKQKKLPFIVCRPLPNSKDYEYWKLNELLS